jgi:hypothetical protein
MNGCRRKTFVFVYLAVGHVYPATILEGALEAQQLAATDSKEPHFWSMHCWARAI